MMQMMTIHVKKFHGDYDISKKCLSMCIVKGSILQTEVDESSFKVELIFDSEATWMMGEMVDALKNRTTYEFGDEPKKKRVKMKALARGNAKAKLKSHD